MAKKNKPKEITLKELVTLAEATDFQSEILHVALREECDSNADMAYEDLTEHDSLTTQLDFLFLQGYSRERLKEIIEKKSLNHFEE